MPERFKGMVSKTIVGNSYREFESHSLRTDEYELSLRKVKWDNYSRKRAK